MNAPISALLERKGSTVYSVSPTMSVAETVAEMNRHHVGCVLVMEGSRIAGIFTERDVLRRVVGAGLDPKSKCVTEVMTRAVLTIGPETTVEAVMTIFAEKRCRHLPVVSHERVLGVISIGDTSRWISEEGCAEAEHLRNYIGGQLA